MTDLLIPTDTYHLRPKNFLLKLLVNAAINTLISVILTIIGFGSGFITNFVFSQCIGMSIFSLSLAIFPLFRRITRFPLQVVTIVATIITGALVGTLLGAVLNGMNPVLFVKDYAGSFGQILLLALFPGFVISYFFISLNIISDEKVKRLAAEKNALEGELKLLQSQMEPHFLFNTLSNVLSLIDTDPERAKRMLESFTAFLRTSLLTARERAVPLYREIDVIRNYLDIYAVRMGKRLHYSIDVQDDVRDVSIPPLLIQPLVENALKHGLEPAQEGGGIEIRAVRDGNIVRISVADSGIGFNDKNAGAGVGLGNIKQRLLLMYGARGRMILKDNTPAGVIVIIEVPYETNQNRHC